MNRSEKEAFEAFNIFMNLSKETPHDKKMAHDIFNKLIEEWAENNPKESRGLRRGEPLWPRRYYPKKHRKRNKKIN